MTPQSPEQYGSVPGRIWYALAVLVFLAGMAVPAVFLAGWLLKFGDDFVRVTVPGQAELFLDPGTYTIFHEQGSTTDGTDGVITTVGNITGLRISVRRHGGGAAIPLKADAASRYSIGSRSGEALFTFTLTEPGTYRLTATYDDGRPGPKAALAIARGFMENFPKTFLGGLVIGFGSLVIALAIGIYVFRRRWSALGPSIQYIPNVRIIFAFYFDLVTGWLLGVVVTELLTGLLAKGGFSLPVWPWVLMSAVMGGYFVVSHWLFTGTPWEYILKTRRRPGTET